MKLSPKALALTLGLIWAAGLAVMTLLAANTGYLKQFADLWVGIYPYYEVSNLGALAGLAWGFVDGFIGGLVLAWVYNFFAPGSSN